MLKVNRFDKFTCQVLRNELNAVLKKFGADVNLEFAVGNMKFTEQGANIMVEAKVKGGKTVADERLVQVAKTYGYTLEPVNGRQLVAYLPKSYKYTFVYKDLRDGKRYKCSEFSADAYFKPANPAAA